MTAPSTVKSANEAKHRGTGDFLSLKRQLFVVELAT